MSKLTLQQAERCQNIELTSCKTSRNRHCWFLWRYCTPAIGYSFGYNTNQCYRYRQEKHHVKLWAYMHIN